MVSSRDSFPKGRLLSWICWGAILLLALLFRILPIRSGLPYSDYVDEGHVLHQTIDAFNNRSLDVYWYGLPALPAYCTGVGLLIYGPLYHHFHGRRFQEDLPRARDLPSSKLNYDFIAPVELIIAGRVATACLSVASVILGGTIGARLAGNRAGLVAMLLMAVCPALVTRASIVIADTFATFFVLVVLYSCTRIQMKTSKTIWRDVALAGVATGLAFASKYPAATVGVAVIAASFIVPVRYARRLQLFLLAAGGVTLGISVGAPMTFLKPVTVWRDVVANVRAYGQIHSPEGYLRQATSSLELGVPLLLAGLIGLILMLRQAKTRAVALGWICFATLLIASFMGQSFRPFRSFLPLVPPLCIAAAISFSELVNWAWRGAHRWLRVGVTLALLGACVVSPGYSSFQQARQRMAHQDSRIQAIAWLQQHAGKEKTVLAIRELMILPTEWKRIAASSTVIPWFEAIALLQRQRFDYIVTGEFDLRYASDLNAWTAYRDKWQKRLAILPVQADFGQIATPVVSYLWRTNDERILIFGGSMPR